jgi:hypothetical protein
MSILLNNNSLNELVNNVIIPIEYQIAFDENLKPYFEEDNNFFRVVNFLKISSILLKDDYNEALQKLKELEYEWKNLKIDLKLLTNYLIQFRNSYTEWTQKHISKKQQDELGDRLQILYEFCNDLTIQYDSESTIESYEELLYRLQLSLEQLQENSKVIGREEFLVIYREVVKNLICLCETSYGLNYMNILLKELYSVLKEIDIDIFKEKEFSIKLLVYLLKDIYKLFDNIVKNLGLEFDFEISNSFFANIMKLKVAIQYSKNSSSLTQMYDVNIAKFAKQIIKDGNKAIQNYNKKNQVENDFDDDSFFDFDSDKRDEKLDNMHYEEEEKIDAITFMSENTIESDIIDDLKDMFDEVSYLNEHIFDEELLEKLQKIFAYFVKLFHSTFEFNDISYNFEVLESTIMSINLNELNDSQKEIFKAMLFAIISDVEKFFYDVIINQTAKDIHYMDASMLANIAQIDIMMNMQPNETDENGEDDEDIFF